MATWKRFSIQTAPKIKEPAIVIAAIQEAFDFHETLWTRYNEILENNKSSSGFLYPYQPSTEGIEHVPYVKMEVDPEKKEVFDNKAISESEKSKTSSVEFIALEMYEPGNSSTDKSVSAVLTAKGGSSEDENKGMTNKEWLLLKEKLLQLNVSKNDETLKKELEEMWKIKQKVNSAAKTILPGFDPNKHCLKISSSSVLGSARLTMEKLENFPSTEGESSDNVAEEHKSHKPNFTFFESNNIGTDNLGFQNTCNFLGGTTSDICILENPLKPPQLIPKLKRTMSLPAHLDKWMVDNCGWWCSINEHFHSELDIDIQKRRYLKTRQLQRKWKEQQHQPKLYGFKESLIRIRDILNLSDISNKEKIEEIFEEIHSVDVESIINILKFENSNIEEQAQKARNYLTSSNMKKYCGYVKKVLTALTRDTLQDNYDTTFLKASLFVLKADVLEFLIMQE